MNTFCAAFGARLREERERKGLSQADFGALGGVGKLAQLNYEKGERSPSADYLAAIGRHGVDIDYLLFGVRMQLSNGPEDAATRAIQEAILTRGGTTPRPMPVDAAVLADAIAAVEAVLSNTGIEAPPSRRARWSANLYLAFSLASPQERMAMKSAAALLVSEWIHVGSPRE